MTAARTQDVLDWLQRVLEEHDKSREAREHTAVLLASSLAERERWMPLVEDVFRAAGGVVVDATTCGSGTECGSIEDDAPLLVGEVQAILAAYNAIDSTADLRLVIDAGRAQIVGETPIDSANAAQRAVREVVTAMCDIRLRAGDLMGIVYAEDALDDAMVTLVWASLMRLPNHIAVSPQATLCVIAGDSNVRIGIHCAGDPSLRYRIDDGHLQVRHGYAQSARRVRELGLWRREDAPLVVLFLGAGTSAGDGLPIGDALRDVALGRLMSCTVSPSTFDDVARRWYGRLDGDGRLEEHERAAGVEEFVRTLTLERVLEYEQAIDGTPNCTTIRGFAAEHGRLFTALESRRVAGDLANHPMVRLCGLRSRLVLVTVNFDRLVEARAGDNVRAYYKAEELEGFPSDLADYIENGGPVPLLKLHGDIENPETLVATTGETYAGLTGPRMTAIEALVTALGTKPVKPWWYVGYSMRDRDLESVWTNPAFPGFNEHWVAPFLDPNVQEFIAKHRMLRWGGQSHSRAWNAAERLVSLTAEDFFAELDTVAQANWS